VDGSATGIVLAIAEDGLTFVVFGTVAFSLLVSILLWVTGGSDSLYDQIGQGGLSREGDEGGRGTAKLLDSAAARAEQELEVRQMLTARHERLLRNGEPGLDVDAEMARLMEPVPEPDGRDATLVEEVRQLVIARNERRVRQGLSELDVEAEVARTLEELDP
jgi:hypothetical protein